MRSIRSRHRKRLPRQRKSFRLDFRLDVYSKLLRLQRVDDDGRMEPKNEVIERLILEAKELPAELD